MRGVLLVLLMLAGCSALLNPDESRLGGDEPGTEDGGRDVQLPPPDATPDVPVGCPTNCNDGVPCTADRCVAGTCQNTPDDNACGEGQRCNTGRGCVAEQCSSNTDCDDTFFCNGFEVCNPSSGSADPTTGCVPGRTPDCSDDWSCTVDGCDEANDRCKNEADHAACNDSVSCTTDECNPSRTDDSTGCTNNPVDAACSDDWCAVGQFCDPDVGCIGGSARDCRDGNACTADTCDASAMMCLHAPRDDDGDGFSIRRTADRFCGGPDCNDSDPLINPSAVEICNGIDDNCDGLTDNACTRVPDECETAEEIDLSPGGVASISGSFSDFRNDEDTRCSSGGRDAVYYVDIVELSDITIDTIGSAADTALAIGAPCTAGFDRACNDNIRSPSDRASRIWVHNFGPGMFEGPRRLFILVEGATAGESRDFLLNIQVDTANDTCDDTIDITGGGTLAGTLQSGIFGAHRGSCESGVSSGRESVARFTASDDGTSRFSATSPNFVPNLYVRRGDCEAADAEIACQAGAPTGGPFGGGTAILDVTTPPSGSRNMYLFIDNGRGGNTYWVDYEP